MADWGLANFFVSTLELMKRWRYTAADAIKHFDLLKFEDLKAIVVMVDQLASDWGPRPLDKYSGAVLSSEWEALMGNCWQRLEEPGTFTASSFLQEIRDARAQVKIENEPLPSRAIRQPSIGVLS